MEQYLSSCRKFAAACLILLIAGVVHAQITILGSGEAVGIGGTGIGGTIETRVNTSNHLGLAFDTSLIPTGVPDGWGTTCHGHMIAPGATDGGPLVARTEIAAGTLIMGSSGGSTGRDITFFLDRTTGTRVGTGNAVHLAFDTSLIGVGVPDDWGSTCVAFHVGAKAPDGAANDLVNDRYEAMMNGETFASGTIPAANRQTIGHLIMGSSISSTGRDIMFLIDRIEHTPVF